MKPHFGLLAAAFTYSPVAAADKLQEYQLLDIRLRIACSIVALIIGLPSALLVLTNIYKKLRNPKYEPTTRIPENPGN